MARPLARCPDQDLPNGMSGTLIRLECRSVGRLLVWAVCPTLCRCQEQRSAMGGDCDPDRLFEAVGSRVPRRRSFGQSQQTARSTLTRCVCRFVVFLVFLGLHFSSHSTLHFIASGIACGEDKGTKRFLAWMWWKQRTALPPLRWEDRSPALNAGSTCQDSHRFVRCSRWAKSERQSLLT